MNEDLRIFMVVSFRTRWDKIIIARDVDHVIQLIEEHVRKYGRENFQKRAIERHGSLRKPFEYTWEVSFDYTYEGEAKTEGYSITLYKETGIGIYGDFDDWDE